MERKSVFKTSFYRMWEVTILVFLALGLIPIIVYQQGFTLGTMLGLFIGAFIATLFFVGMIGSPLLTLYFRIKQISIAECVACLQSKDETIVHSFAFNKLQSLKTSDALVSLVNLAQDKNIDTGLRKQVLSAIRKAGTHAREYVPMIVNILDSEEKTLRKEALKTLRLVTGLDFGEDAEQWRQHL